MSSKESSVKKKRLSNAQKKRDSINLQQRRRLRKLSSRRKGISRKSLNPKENGCLKQSSSVNR